MQNFISYITANVVCVSVTHVDRILLFNNKHEFILKLCYVDAWMLCIKCVALAYKLCTITCRYQPNDTVLCYFLSLFVWSFNHFSNWKLNSYWIIIDGQVLAGDIRTHTVHKIPNILYDFKINDELFKKCGSTKGINEPPTSGSPQVFVQHHSAQWAIHGWFLDLRMITDHAPVHHPARNQNQLQQICIYFTDTCSVSQLLRPARFCVDVMLYSYNNIKK